MPALVVTALAGVVAPPPVLEDVEDVTIVLSHVFDVVLLFAKKLALALTRLLLLFIRMRGVLPPATAAKAEEA